MDAVDAWRSLSRLGTGTGSRLGREMNPRQMQSGFLLADRSSVACESRMSSYGPVNFQQNVETVDGQQMHLSTSAHHRRRKKGLEYPMVNLNKSLLTYTICLCMPVYTAVYIALCITVYFVVCIACSICMYVNNLHFCI